jgi:hypothetical protein
VSQRGDVIAPPLPGANVALGGVMGQGKSNAARVTMASAALDPLAELWVFVFANNGDFDAFRPQKVTRPFEVDVVQETPDGRIVGVEVKAGATVRAADLTGLRNLANQTGDRFVAGFVLYTGPQTLPFGGKIRAVPLDALWHLAP